MAGLSSLTELKQESGNGTKGGIEVVGRTRGELSKIGAVYRDGRRRKRADGRPATTLDPC